MECVTGSQNFQSCCKAFNICLQQLNEEVEFTTEGGSRGEAEMWRGGDRGGAERGGGGRVGGGSGVGGDGGRGGGGGGGELIFKFKKPFKPMKSKKLS